MNPNEVARLADAGSNPRQITFGQYVLLRRIATGGMAEIFLAKQTGISGFERLVVVKRILPHLAANREFITMFMDEARIAGQLSHPNVVQIFDVGRILESCFIAMEYIHGEDVRKIYNQEVQRANRMPVELSVHILAQAAHGLDYAHRKPDISGAPLGLVHRDVSPQNILVTYDGHVKIVDFGVAKAANKMAQTRSGVLKGKYSYMSPEQAQGLKLDCRTDIFALGVVLYEITCGVRLFKRENEMETLQAVINCDVPLPSSHDPNYPPALEKIVMKALSKNVSRRQQTAGELAKELEDFARDASRLLSPSDVAKYMQGLFADQLAEEALVGAGLWDEDHTNEGRKAEQKAELAFRQNDDSEHAHFAATAPMTLPMSLLERDAREETQAKNLRAGTPQPFSGHWSSATGPSSAGLDTTLEKLDSGSIDLEAESKNDPAFKPLVDLPATVASRRVGASEKAAVRREKLWRLLFLSLAVSGVVIGVVALWLHSGGFDSATQSGPAYFNSHPEGATVYLDGVRVTDGKTPLFLARPLAAGPHTVRLELDGYQPSEGEFHSSLSGRTTFERDLLPVVHAPVAAVVTPALPATEKAGTKSHKDARANGQLSIKSTLPLHVFAGKLNLGVTPIQRSLPPGAYTLHAQHDAGGFSEMRKIVLEAGGNQKIDIDMPVGHLRVTLQPAGTIKIGSLTLSAAAGSLDLPAGHYTVRVMNKLLGKDETIETKVSEGQETLIERNWNK